MGPIKDAKETIGTANRHVRRIVEQWQIQHDNEGQKGNLDKEKGCEGRLAVRVQVEVARVGAARMA